MWVRLLFVFSSFLYFKVIPFAQTNGVFVKAIIDLKGKQIHDLARVGIETDHGILVPQRHFISDFSSSELEEIQKLGFTYQVLIDDVSGYYASPDRIDAEDRYFSRQPGQCDGLPVSEFSYTTPLNYTPGSLNGYFTYSEIMQQLDDMAAMYPDLISPRNPINGFPTHNGNFLHFVKLSDNVAIDEGEPEVLYTALHHAREPNSASQMIFYLWYLLENYGKDPVVTRIVNETELYFIPCVNPDGYLQNQQTHPNGGGLWRKNMWKDSLGNVKGVDLNRNYGFFWGFDDTGSSTNPNAQTFRGEAPFSEPETQAIRAFCLERNFSMALNYHTFGNYLIHPWGYNDQPTNEDVLFKGMGRIVNQENQFLMGTAIETVGYKVNGVSDDWMYGDRGEKNKIYAYTPEVGPSFWPAPGSIDRLNKSCVWMNMATALLTLSYYDVADDQDDGILTPQNKQVNLSVSRFGLKEGTCKLKLISNTSGVKVSNAEKTISLDLASSNSIMFMVDIEPDMINESEISFTLEIDNEGVVASREIKRLWIPNLLSTVFEDKASSKQQIAGNGWTLTEKDYISSPYSITDSESGNYEANTDQIFTFVRPFDLSQANHAFLEFYAKWDIESSYDYVQVQASRDSIDFIPLCGKYTRPGSPDQSFNSPIYDGKQDAWVKEFINMSDFSGSKKVWLRFQLKSDDYLEKDGFYVDDLRVLADIPVSNVVEVENSKLTIFPTVIAKHERLSLSGLIPVDDTTLALYNAEGIKVFEQKLAGGVKEISHNLGLAGMYYYTINVQGVMYGSGKIIVH